MLRRSFLGAKHCTIVFQNTTSLQSCPAIADQKRGIVFRMRNTTPANIVGYYAIFPVIPDETVENNSFMYNIAKGEDWPKLATSSPREMYEGTVRMLMEYGATSLEHMEYLSKLPAEERTFDKVVGPLLNEEYDVNYAFQTLVLKMLTDWTDGNRKLFDADLHHIKIMCARDQGEKLMNPDFQEAISDLYHKKEGLDEWQLRLLEWYLLEIKATGLDRRDEKTTKLLGAWSKWTDEYRSKYITNCTATNDQFTWTVEDKGALRDAPPHVLQQLAVDPQKWETGPWRARMTPNHLLPFMQYCGNRPQRAEAWEKWTSKASFEHDFYNNSINIEELRHNNDGLAKLMGYRSVADHRLSNKMATSPETVRMFLDALVKRIRPVVIDRMDSWREYAQAKELMNGDLQAHDLFYICRREADHHFGVDFLNVMNYFPFWPTFNNMLNLVENLFGLQFKDITDTGLERAHADARIFSVADKTTGQHLGRLYIDPYDREGKRGGWNANLARTQSDARGLDKLVYMIGCAIAPSQNSPSLLHHAQLQQLLFHFGRSIQLLLSESPYRDIAIPWAPFYASDWDAANMFPTFLQFFVYKPSLLQALSSPHLKTGTQLDEDAANSIALALQRGTLFESYRTLFWSDFDLTVYEMENRQNKFWLDIYREMYKEYFPFRQSKNDYHPCSFFPVFALQPYMGMYYRKLWAEMLALEIHDTFDKENDECSTGERLKNTILKRGAGNDAKELYRRFHGRDPSVGAICDFYAPPAHYPYEEDASSARG